MTAVLIGGADKQCSRLPKSFNFLIQQANYLNSVHSILLILLEMKALIVPQYYPGSERAFVGWLDYRILVPFS